MGDAKIVAIGETRELIARYPAAEVIDLAGATIYPGFADSHAHVYGTGERATKPRLEGCASLGDVRKILSTIGTGSEWVVLRGWDHNKWGMTSFPTRHDLDKIIADRPVALTRVDGHALWCNSKALDQCNINSTTQAPSGGEILKDTAGVPTGILLDEAMKLVESKIPLPSTVGIRDTLRAGLQTFAQYGNTSVHDMGVPAYIWSELRALYDEEGDALPRCFVFLDMNQETGKQLFLDSSDERCSTVTHPNLKLHGIKIYLDGALGSRGAELFEDYSDDPGNRGLALSDDDEVIALMQRAAQHGLQIAVHAIGDKANARALDLFERAGVSRSTLCRIEHAQIVRDQDVRRFAGLGVWALIQPPFYSSDRHWAIERLGAARMKTAYRWKSLLDAGVNVVASSDSPVEPPHTMGGIRLLVSRDGVEDGEGVSEQEAVRLYTTAAAELDGMSKLRGKLEAGYMADLTILDRPVFDADARVVKTVVGGKHIFDAIPA